MKGSIPSQYPGVEVEEPPPPAHEQKSQVPLSSVADAL
jgi:hypothetical protein